KGESSRVRSFLAARERSLVRSWAVTSSKDRGKTAFPDCLRLERTTLLLASTRWGARSTCVPRLSRMGGSRTRWAGRSTRRCRAWLRRITASGPPHALALSKVPVLDAGCNFPFRARLSGPGLIAEAANLLSAPVGRLRSGAFWFPARASGWYARSPSRFGAGGFVQAVQRRRAARFRRQDLRGRKCWAATSCV